MTSRQPNMKICVCEDVKDEFTHLLARKAILEEYACKIKENIPCFLPLSLGSGPHQQLRLETAHTKKNLNKFAREKTCRKALLTDGEKRPGWNQIQHMLLCL